MVLNEEIYYLVNEVLSFNLKAYAIESIGRNISLCYEELKEQISTVLSYAFKYSVAANQYGGVQEINPTSKGIRCTIEIN